MARPDWDRYFLDLCEAVSKRSTCDRGKAGCVIVKDKLIMTTGYVGSPTGLPHCNEVGHDMRKVVDDSGNVSQHCVRTLMQSKMQSFKLRNLAYIDGATLFVK
jgi:dCMP deaminase